jgi:hypothetical protein
VVIPSILARKALELQKVHFFLNLISADDPVNVHAGELAMRPPRAPTTQRKFDGWQQSVNSSYEGLGCQVPLSIPNSPDKPPLTAAGAGPPRQKGGPGLAAGAFVRSERLSDLSTRDRPDSELAAAVECGLSGHDQLLYVSASRD